MMVSEPVGDGGTITVRVPIAIRKRGGRKVVLAPDGIAGDTRRLFCQRVDNAMVKAFARAFRWREMLETGAYKSIKELADAENINESYVARILRLTLLAPDIVESIVDGTQAREITLSSLKNQFESVWTSQRSSLGSGAH